MNSNRRVFHFALYSVGLLILLSLADLFFDFHWNEARRVNLVADVFTTPTTPATDSSINNPPAAIVVADKPSEDFSLYKNAKLITDFKADTNTAALPALVAKLHELKSGKPVKIRIAYFGDSMIEGDLLTQTLRELLQKAFGGNGVGFVPITSQVSQFRQTVRASYPDSWTEENFKEGKSSKLYLSGHLFRTDNGWVQMTDQTIRDSVNIEKSLLCGPIENEIRVRVNSQPVAIHPMQSSNRIVLNNDASRSINFAIADQRLPVYGISFESASGVFVDNFSFRGITGIEFARVDSSFLSAVSESNPYDLIVFQYGVNLLFRPKDKDFSWYSKMMMPVIRKIRHCFPNSEFLLISTADRAFRYGANYQSAVGIDSLVKLQAAMAYETGSAFYNQFASMGGTNSIVDWASRKPALANQDHVHPNQRGAEILANYLFQSLMKEYDEYLRAIK